MRRLILLMLLIMAGCQKGISSEEAINIARDFVDERVRFTTTVDNERTFVNYANNTIKNVYAEGNEWHVDIYVEASTGNETKRAYFTVIIDKFSGEIKDIKQIPLNQQVN